MFQKRCIARRLIGGLLGVTFFAIVGCQAPLATPEPQQGTLYFRSPEESVVVINRLLKNEDWVTLGSYYDLAGTSIDRRSAQSRDFFVRDERPAVAHPAAFWKYKQPFAPGFEYVDTRPATDASVVQVDVRIQISEGGGMVQRGADSFHLRKSDLGYQLLPKAVEMPRTSNSPIHSG